MGGVLARMAMQVTNIAVKQTLEIGHCRLQLLFLCTLGCLKEQALTATTPAWQQAWPWSGHLAEMALHASAWRWLLTEDCELALTVMQHQTPTMVRCMVYKFHSSDASK